MSWLRIALTEDEQVIVNENRDAHPSSCVRGRMLVMWSLHCGLTRSTAAEISNMDLSNVQRIVKLYRDGGFEALLKSNRTYVPTSELAQFEEVIRNSLEQQPARTIAEACARIKELTGLERGPTQVRKFLKSIGLKWQRVRAIPVPPKKVWLST